MVPQSPHPLIFPHELDDPLPSQYTSMRLVAHRVAAHGGLEVVSTLEIGNPLPLAAGARPGIEKFCIRFDDWFYDSPYSTIRKTLFHNILQWVTRYACKLLQL